MTTLDLDLGTLVHACAIAIEEQPFVMRERALNRLHADHVSVAIEAGWAALDAIRFADALRSEICGLLRVAGRTGGVGPLLH